MAWSKSPRGLIALFDELVPDDPRVTRRRMFGYPAAFACGNMFIGLFQDDVVLRLSAQDRAAFEAEHGARPFEPTPGRRMREYVCLPEEMLDDPDIRGTWIARSLAYAANAPPRAKRSKKTTP